MDILLLSDNPNAIALFTFIMQTRNLQIKPITEREKLKEACINDDCLAIVLDFPNPKPEDFDYWRELLRLTPTPVLILSSDRSNVEKVLARQQATIHLAEPLLGMFQNLYRERAEEAADSAVGRPVPGHIPLAHGVVFDVARHCISRNNECFTLSSTEFKLLYLLSTNMDRSFSAQELMDHLNLIGISAIYVHIQKIREKIEEDPRNPSILVNKRGYGYKIQAVAQLTLIFIFVFLMNFLYSI